LLEESGQHRFRDRRRRQSHARPALIYICDLPGIASFKIVQESRQRVRVQIVAAADFPSAMEQRIQDGFRARLGASVEVTIELVDVIEPERSGKFRYVVSHAMP
jgi:phenylacetate-CoA ligase